MTATTMRTSVKVILKQRVIVSGRLVFEAEREVRLPIQPFVGLVLYHVDWHPPGCDDGEEVVEQIAYDLKNGHLICYFDIHDFRFKASVGHWPAKWIRERF